MTDLQSAPPAQCESAQTVTAKLPSARNCKQAARVERNRHILCQSPRICAASPRTAGRGAEERGRPAVRPERFEGSHTLARPDEQVVAHAAKHVDLLERTGADWRRRRPSADGATGWRASCAAARTAGRTPAPTARPSWGLAALRGGRSTGAPSAGPSQSAGGGTWHAELVGSRAAMLVSPPAALLGRRPSLPPTVPRRPLHALETLPQPTAIGIEAAHRPHVAADQVPASVRFPAEPAPGTLWASLSEDAPQDAGRE